MTLVQNYDGTELTLKGGEIIKTKTVIWAAGVIANPVPGLEAEAFTPQKRLLVDRHNQVLSYRDIYALGDLASMSTPLYPKGHPQVANVAINQAKLLAKNLRQIVLNKPLKDYEYKDLGSMATIGKHKAVVNFGTLSLQGYVAWQQAEVVVAGQAQAGDRHRVVQQLQVFGIAGGLRGAHADFAHVDAVEPQPGQRAEYHEADDLKGGHVPILPVARCLRSGPCRRFARKFGAPQGLPSVAGDTVSLNRGASR